MGSRVCREPHSASPCSRADSSASAHRVPLGVSIVADVVDDHFPTDPVASSIYKRPLSEKMFGERLSWRGCVRHRVHLGVAFSGRCGSGRVKTDILVSVSLVKYQPAEIVVVGALSHRTASRPPRCLRHCSRGLGRLVGGFARWIGLQLLIYSLLKAKAHLENFHRRMILGDRRIPAAFEVLGYIKSHNRILLWHAVCTIYIDIYHTLG